MSNQKFKRGDVVRISKDLGPTMQHFECDQDAVVIGSYKDQYGGGSNQTEEYTLLLCNDGAEVSWYYENQLTFLRHGGEEEIEKTKFQRTVRDKTEQDIHWICANWLSIRERPSGATMATLMKLIGITNPWPHGEGWELAMNQERAYRILDDALSTGDLSVLNRKLTELGQENVE